MAKRTCSFCGLKITKGQSKCPYCSKISNENKNAKTIILSFVDSVEKEIKEKGKQDRLLRQMSSSGIPNIYCRIDGVMYNLENILPLLQENTISLEKVFNIVSTTCNLDEHDCKILTDRICSNKAIPKKYVTIHQVQMKKKVREARKQERIILNPNNQSEILKEKAAYLKQKPVKTGIKTDGKTNTCMKCNNPIWNNTGYCKECYREQKQM